MACIYGIEQNCSECRMCEKKEHEKARVTEAEIVVRGTQEKPYFEIKYLEVGKSEYSVGYSSYNLEYVFQWLREEFEVVKEKPTNADRIRGMSNAELAEFLQYISKMGYVHVCCPDEGCDMDFCEYCLDDWSKKEREG